MAVAQSGYQWSTATQPSSNTGLYDGNGNLIQPYQQQTSTGSIAVSAADSELNKTTCKDEGGTYCLLEPIPIGTGGGTLDTVQPTTSFGSYINIIIKILIGIVGVLAVVTIVLGGIQYMTTDAFSRKEGGKEMITRSVVGLLIALGSVLLLNTINPQLSAIVFSVDEVRVVLQEDWQDGTTSAQPGGTSASAASQRAASYRSGMRDPGTICTQGSGPNAQIMADLLGQAQQSKTAGNFKNLQTLGVPVQSSGKETYKTLADKLKNLSTAYGSSNFTVTEAWQPQSTAHCARCHYLGTCVDIGLSTTNASSTEVTAFITAARDAGLIAQYEVKTEDDFNTIGITDGSVIVVPYATGKHFSVYDRQ